LLLGLVISNLLVGLRKIALMKKSTFWILALIVITQIACNSRNQNHWSQFRGVGALGIAPENATPPVDFGTDKNILWEIETPEGLSPPFIVDDNLFFINIFSDLNWRRSWKLAPINRQSVLSRLYRINSKKHISAIRSCM